MVAGRYDERRRAVQSMKTFHCDFCQQLVFFENVRCVRCDHVLAYAADADEILALEPGEADQWRSHLSETQARAYRLCQNYGDQEVCTWAIPAESADDFCLSCRLTKVIPDLGVAGNRERWFRLESAKRRLIYSLLRLNLPLANKTDDPQHGLAFEFLADAAPGGPQVLTGHHEGLITVNLAEADDAEREKRRLAMHEPYRTLLGHFRHESGHYFWDRLIRDSDWIGSFRERFGDEGNDYAAALQKYYEAGTPLDWQERFVSAYACSHPWEDWAETWAHYLHMTDALETAAASGLWLRPSRADEPTLKPIAPKRGGRLQAFDVLIENWFPLTYALNNLNRGLGLPDAYPFVLSSTVIEKLRFVHERICALADKEATVLAPL
jgi:hypothetical protein